MYCLVNPGIMMRQPRNLLSRNRPAAAAELLLLLLLLLLTCLPRSLPRNLLAEGSGWWQSSTNQLQDHTPEECNSPTRSSSSWLLSDSMVDPAAVAEDHSGNSKAENVFLLYNLLNHISTRWHHTLALNWHQYWHKHWQTT
jgi:hypothetical protein